MFSNSPCRRTSWFNKLREQDEEEDGSRYKYPFQVSMYCAMLIVSSTGYGDITATSILEMYMMLVFFIIGMLIFSFLVSDYSATLMLSGRSKSVNNLKKPNLKNVVHIHFCDQSRF